MFCKSCGKRIDDDAKFCPNCGKTVGGGTVVQNAAVGSGGYTVNPVSPVSSGKPQQAQSSNKRRGCLRLIIFAAIALVILWLISSALNLFGDIVAQYGSAESYSGNYDSSYTYTDEGGVSGVSLGLTNLRDKYTTLKGDGSDTVTVMIYMIASDLESKGGFATSDINEMLAATYGDKVQIVLQTGGTRQWQNSVMDSSVCQRWVIKGGQLYSAGDIGRANMTLPATLSDFIQYSASNFAADRYQLILWNHGGGTMMGYGYDENYPNSMMNLADLDQALIDGGVKFDFIGFDACLMATVETAYVVQDHADYLIASEESEPGTGWAYTNWLTELNENTSVDTVDLGKRIVDDFVAAGEELGYESSSTLSIVDLREIPNVYDQLCSFLNDSQKELDDYKFSELSRARSDVRDYGEGQYEQIDVYDLAEKLTLEYSDELMAAISSAVKYRNQSSNMGGSHGLAMYYPYANTQYYGSVLRTQNAIGMGQEYTGYFSRFLSAMSSGKSMTPQTVEEHISGASEAVDYTQFDWYDPDTAASYESQAGADYSELVITEKGEYFVLKLTDEQWADITKIESQVFLDDGEGYIDLGSDNMWEFDKDGDLIVGYDYTWVAINGQTVAFYAEKEFSNGDDWYTYGYVPVEVNGEYAELILYWDNDNPNGYVAGYRPVYDEGASSKGLLEITEGMTIDIICDYYTYEGEYVDSYYFNDTITVDANGLAVSYEDVGDFDSLMWLTLTDLYQNVYFTESVEYSAQQQ